MSIFSLCKKTIRETNLISFSFGVGSLKLLFIFLKSIHWYYRFAQNNLQNLIFYWFFHLLGCVNDSPDLPVALHISRGLHCLNNNNTFFLSIHGKSCVFRPWVWRLYIVLVQQLLLEAFPQGWGHGLWGPFLLSKSMPFLFCGESRAFPESLARVKGGERGRDPSWESICRAEEEEGAGECTLRMSWIPRNCNQ